MNVCLTCGADGVITLAGHWYCQDHIEHGFKHAGGMVWVMISGNHDPGVLERKLLELDEWLADAGHPIE